MINICESEPQREFHCLVHVGLYTTALSHESKKNNKKLASVCSYRATLHISVYDSPQSTDTYPNIYKNIRILLLHISFLFALLLSYSYFRHLISIHHSHLYWVKRNVTCRLKQSTDGKEKTHRTLLNTIFFSVVS